jgi:arginyl-tRNA synthetase
MQQANPFRHELVERLAKATGLAAAEIEDQLGYPPNQDLGDLAFPCFVLSKRERKAPPAVAAELAGKLGLPSARLHSATPAGPYLNVSFQRSAYARWALETALAGEEGFLRSSEGAGRVIAIDYSSPNIAKPFHVGHLRSTIIGGALYRVFDALGYRSVGINHLGDWGTQFGKLIVGWKRWGASGELQDILALNRLYVRYHEAEKENPALAEEAREWFRRQEAGDAEALALWKQIRDVSLEYFQRIYQRLGVRFDSYAGESFYNDKMEAVIDEAKRKGLTEVSEGALIIDLERHGISTPALLKKADGSTLYLTRDLAAALYRKQAYDFHRLLYVVGSEQSLHLQQLFKVLELLGHAWAKDCTHVAFGRVQGMSTRAGNVVYLEELLDEAKARALENMRHNVERRPELEDEEAVAEAVGIAAIFFSDLSNRRIKDYKFDWSRAISFEGDTGPYLLNAHARIAGIIRKCGIEPAAASTGVDFARLEEPEAHRLVALLPRYLESLRLAARDCEPALLANYLLDLAKALHGSYQVLRVKDADEATARARLQLFLAVKRVLAGGLGVLGIPALERM